MDYEEHFETVPKDKETRIRPYAEKDIATLAHMAKKFIPELPNYRDISVDIGRLIYLLNHHLVGSQSFMVYVIVDEKDQPVGCIAGFCNAAMFTWDKVATDSWMFILPGWRTLKNANKLLEAYKTWALRMGAVIIVGSCTGGYQRGQMDILMKRSGFKEIGTVYHIRTDETHLVKQLEALKES